MRVQSPFYVSGFLYNPKTHQILLLKVQKEGSEDFLWSTLGGESNGQEEAPATFQRVINKLLGLDLKTKDIYPIYDYSYDKKDKINYVFYAQIKNPKQFKQPKEGVFAWVAFSEISKLFFTPNSKQDIIVGERVINAKYREEKVKKQALSPNPVL